MSREFCRDVPDPSQRRRDDNKNKICAFEEGGPWGRRGKSSKNALFRGKRHDNKILNLQILLSKFCCHCAGSYPRGVQQVCAKKVRAHFSFPTSQ